MYIASFHVVRLEEKTTFHVIQTCVFRHNEGRIACLPLNAVMFEKFGGALSWAPQDAERCQSVSMFNLHSLSYLAHLPKYFYVSLLF